MDEPVVLTSQLDILINDFGTKYKVICKDSENGDDRGYWKILESA